MKELMKKLNTKLKKERGITLIALVVTIIVLLILAGVSIQMLTGQSGILRNAEEASSRTKEAEAKEELDIWLMEYATNSYANGEDGLKDFLEGKGLTVSETGDGKLEVENGGYKFLVDPDTLETKLKEKGTPEFTVEVGEAKDKKVTVKVTVTNKDELGSIDGAVLKGAGGEEIQGTIDGGEITFEVGENGNYTLELKTTTEGKEKTTTGKVTVDKIEAELAKTLGYGTIEVVWLKETSNEIDASPNKPNLYNEKLTPVKWEEGTNEEKKTTSGDSSWYNYNESKWANAINTEDDSYFVWIPRYAYRITYYADKGVGDPIAYYDGRGLVDSEGNIITKLNGNPVKGKIDEGIETVSQGGKSYIVHPAFMDNTANNYENGGWSKDLEGIWVSKYEMSKETSSNSGETWSASSTSGSSSGNVFTTKASGGEAGTSQVRMVSKPSVSSWRNINIANSYTNSYYYDRAKESHMMKNSEWGAVAYLAHSQYGTNGEEVAINKSSSYITGTGSDGTSSYNTEAGFKSSTTWNIYGIYDISGGAYERVAAYNKDYTGDYFTGANYLDASGKNFANEAGGASTQYVTAYSNNSSTSYGTTLEYNVGKTGDATKEVQTGAGTYNSHWFSDCSYFVYLSNPFFLRGGYYSNGVNAGAFYSSSSIGYAYSNDSFRVVLAQ